MILHVKLDGRDSPVTVEVVNSDRVRWDLHAARQGWPTFDKVPFLGMTFLAWAALKRTGQYVGAWDDFSARDCVDVEAEDTTDNEDNEDANELGKFTVEG